MTALMGVKVDRVDTTQEFALGTIYEAYDGKVYKYITYSEEAAAVDSVAGEAVYYVAATGYGNSDVTSDLSASDEVMAGVVQAVMSDNEFGWIQIGGMATMTIAFTVATDGAPMTPTGSTDGTIDVAAAATDPIGGVAGDASANEVMLQCPR